MIKEENMETTKKLTENKKKIGKLFKFDWKVQIILIVVLLLVLFPFYIMMVTTIETFEETNNAEFVWWPANGPTFDAYDTVLKGTIGGISLMGSLWNTIWIYLPGVLVGLLTSTMAAFAFAKLNFRLKNFLFAFLMATMMMPNVMSMMSKFLIFDAIGWINTPWPLMIPRMFGSMGIIFFIKQYLMGLPDDMLNAAKIDGAGNWGILFNIIIPVAKPVIVAQFVLGFISAYNDYTEPLLYLQDANMYTLQIGLAFFYDPYTQNWPQRMAGCAVTMIPLIILYLLSQKYILEGMAVSASLKG